MIHVQLEVSSRPKPSASYWVYFLQGVDAWDSMKGLLTDDKAATRPPCAKDSCLMSKVIPDGGVNVSLAVNATDEYYMVFYTNFTGSAALTDPTDEEDVSDAANEDVVGMPVGSQGKAKPAPLGTVWYTLNLDLCVYDTANPVLKFQGTSQSEISTRGVDDFIILDFDWAHRDLSPASDPLKDFSNIVVSLECRARIVSYVAVFGFVALVLIILTVIATLCIINKKFGDDPDSLHISSGDYTRLVTDA
jgi:hypothetical protein